LTSANFFVYTSVTDIKKGGNYMSIPITPLADRVVAVLQEAKTQTASGIYLPDAAKEKSVVAKVVATGPDVKSLKIDNKIIYKEYSTTDIKVDGVDYLIIKEEDVLATVK
jgi:chaperonin GroES